MKIPGTAITDKFYDIKLEEWWLLSIHTTSTEGV